MDTDTRVIAVARRETQKGDPRWMLQIAGGDRVNVFDNMLQRRPWENSGYPTWFQAMERGQTDRWMDSPIMVAVARRGEFLKVVSVQPRAPNVQPDKTREPMDVWELFRIGGPRSIRSASRTPS